MFFNSEEDIISFGKENGVVMEKKFSKTKKENIFSYVSGSLAEKITEDCSFIKDIDLKRDKKYFLTESEELVDDKWMTRSFFAFGDFKESINPKYIQALSKSLKNWPWYRLSYSFIIYLINLSNQLTASWFILWLLFCLLLFNFNIFFLFFSIIK